MKNCIKNFIVLYILIFNVKSVENKSEDTYKNSNDNSVHVQLWMLMVMMVFSSIMSLIILGIIKGLLGLFCCTPVGMWSLGALVDLPRPLDSYQEPELADIPVVYDQTGWPIHPHTGKRSVRALSKKTEFFLNSIFFLAYPLAVLVTLCSACCFKEAPPQQDEYYKCVNTVVFNTCIKKDRPCSGNVDCNSKGGSIYQDDSTEEKDTYYVLRQMQRSQQSLQSKHR